MSAGVYIHIPFCKSRCSYCDFATDVFKSGDTVQRYVDALVKEIDSFAHIRPPVYAGGSDLDSIGVDTIYLGGGTPSLLSPDQIDIILKTGRAKFNVDPSAEITMEMNPATVTAETLAGYLALGINRASFGVQTFDNTELKRLARGHTADDARQTYRMLRDTGFENISFDLIAGLPRQTLDDWKRNVAEALSMRPEHLSLYLLEIHDGTPLAEQLRTERQPVPDPELAAMMYEHLLRKLNSAGYEQYEISNFALPGFESRHNTKYWTLDPVIAFGVSAHSFDGRSRFANVRDTAAYVDSIESGRSAEVFREETNVTIETAFLNLRLNRGVDLAAYETSFGFQLDEKYSKEIARVRDAGLVEFVAGRLRLTPKGRLYSNEVFAIFV